MIQGIPCACEKTIFAAIFPATGIFHTVQLSVLQVDKNLSREQIPSPEITEYLLKITSKKGKTPYTSLRKLPLRGQDGCNFYEAESSNDSASPSYHDLHVFNEII